MKKKNLLILAGLVIWSFPTAAQTCADTFRQAQSLMEKELYADAIIQLESAMECDPYLRQDCKRLIKICKEKLQSVPYLTISEQEVIIPYQGGDRQIEVLSKGNWSIEGQSDLCRTEISDKSKMIVQCREQNNSTRAIITKLTVTSGGQYKTVSVIQEGRPEYLETDVQSFSFPAKGSQEYLSVNTNAEWDIASIPSWCKVERQADTLRITVLPNEHTSERSDKIEIISPNRTVVVKISQTAGEEKLVLSQNEINVSEWGESRVVRVYSDGDWYVGDFPTWMNASKVGEDSLKIQCGQNIPNDLSRSGSVLVKSGNKTVGILVTQFPLKVQDLIMPDSELLGGNRFSIGFNASYMYPMVNSTSGGEYTGSVVDYGLGTGQENASYQNTFGYSVGILADIRLYKNIYLSTGVNYSHVEFENYFNQNTDFRVNDGRYYYLRGIVQNSYTEKYSMSFVEVPILVSYRIKLDNVSHFGIEAGPVISYGLEANMNLSGTTDSETMRKYSNVTERKADNGNYVNHTAVNADFNLFQPCVLWNQVYTTGNDQPAPVHSTFASAPMTRLNYGARLGIHYEWAGLSVGLSYTYMISNMAKKSYWESDRFTVLNNSDTGMKGVKFGVNSLELKLAYTLRYYNFKK